MHALAVLLTTIVLVRSLGFLVLISNLIDLYGTSTRNLEIGLTRAINSLGNSS